MNRNNNGHAHITPAVAVLLSTFLNLFPHKVKTWLFKLFFIKLLSPPASSNQHAPVTLDGCGP